MWAPTSSNLLVTLTSRYQAATLSGVSPPPGAGPLGMIHAVMIHTSSQLRLLTLALCLVLASSTASEKRPHFLLRAVDASTSMLPTAGPNNFSNCVLVLPDGRFYISLRRQEIMDGTATVKGLEGSLDLKALQILRGLLDESTIRNAPNFDHPNTPFTVDEFQVFEAQIDRDSSVQRVGYFSWRGKGPDNPDSAKKQWQESEVALQPLVEWFRALKTNKYPLKRPVSKSARFSCDFDDDPPSRSLR
jgi:hypothetical protein